MLKKLVSACICTAMLSSAMAAGVAVTTSWIKTDFTDGILPQGVASKEIRSEVNTDPEGYHFETGVGGRAADDKSLVVKLEIPKGMADENTKDGIQVGVNKGEVNGYRTAEFSVLFDGDYDYGTVFENVKRGGAAYNDLVQFMADGKVMVRQNNSMKLAGYYHKGEWIKVAISWNTTGAYKLYLNDLLAVSGYGIGSSGDVKNWGWFNVNTCTAANESDEVKNVTMALDDLKVYDGTYDMTEYADRIAYSNSMGNDYTLIKNSGSLIIPQNSTLADLKSGIGVTNGTVRVYTDGTYQSQLTDTAAIVPEGAKVVVQATKNDRIDTLTVTHDAAKKEISSFDFEGEISPVSFVDAKNYGTDALKEGTYGKETKMYQATASNVPADVEGGGRISLLDSLPSMGSFTEDGGTYLLATEKSKMTLEYSFLADGDYTNISFIGRPYYLNYKEIKNVQGYTQYLSIAKDGSVQYTDDQNTQQTSDIKLLPGQWNRFAFEVNPESLGMRIFINGQLAVPFVRLANGYTDRDTYIFKGFSWLSPVLQFSKDSEAANTRTASMAIDDMEVYYGNYKADSADEAKILGTNLGMDGNTLYLSDDASVLSFITESNFGNATAKVYMDSSCTQTLSADDEMSAGNVVVLTSESGKAYSYYNIRQKAAEEIKTYIDNTEGNVIVAPCTLKAAYGGAEGSGVLMMAVYKNGQLIKLVSDDSAAHEVSYTVADTNGITAKAMLWNSLKAMKPVAASKEFINVGVIE